MILKRVIQRQPATFVQRSWTAMIGSLLLAGTFSQAVSANWYDPPRPMARWDEPLFVASETAGDHSIVWRYGHDSIMPVVAMQEESPLPSPIPLVPMLPLPEEAEMIDSPPSNQQEYGEPLEDFNVQSH